MNYDLLKKLLMLETDYHKKVLYKLECNIKDPDPYWKYYRDVNTIWYWKEKGILKALKGIEVYDLKSAEEFGEYFGSCCDKLISWDKKIECASSDDPLFNWKKRRSTWSGLTDEYELFYLMSLHPECLPDYLVRLDRCIKKLDELIECDY